MFVEVVPAMSGIYKGYRHYEIWLNYYIKIVITVGAEGYYMDYSEQTFKLWCQKDAFE